MKIEDIEKAISLIKPFPIKRVRVGKRLYKKLKNKALFIRPKAIGSLYGLNIYIDETLRPGEYRFDYD